MITIDNQGTLKKLTPSFIKSCIRLPVTIQGKTTKSQQRPTNFTMEPPIAQTLRTDYAKKCPIIHKKCYLTVKERELHDLFQKIVNFCGTNRKIVKSKKMFYPSNKLANPNSSNLKLTF